MILNLGNTMLLVKIFLILVGTLQLLQVAAAGFAFLLGSIATQPETIIQMNSMTNIPLLLLSGWFASASNFAPYLIPFKYLSLFKYGYQILNDIEFGGDASTNNCFNQTADKVTV